MPAPPYRRLGLLGGLLLAGMGGGCIATPDGSTKTTAYMISTATSEFYKYGPAQAFGPDTQLKRGDRVTLLQKQFGFSHIMLADGTSGYVPTEDLAPAPAPPVVKPTAALTGSNRSSSSRRRNSNVAPTAGDPLFDINDVPAPALPSDPVHSPTFRY